LSGGSQSAQLCEPPPKTIPMHPLTLDDLMPMEEYASRRREFFAAHQSYLDRYRRVRVGPRAALLFENRQTLWFRVQELLRIARLSDGQRVQQELDVYNRLLPDRDRLQAALLVEVVEEARLTDELAIWQAFHGEDLRFRIGATRLPATLVTCRPEDRVIGAAHWVQFLVDEDGRQLLADLNRVARLEIDLPGYRHESLPLSDDVRQSLLDDLSTRS
jgi:hypothetical protein